MDFKKKSNYSIYRKGRKNMKKWTIYCHINKINNKRYIGQTDQ